MDLTEEEVSFDQIPQVVSELKDEIRGLKVLISSLTYLCNSFDSLFAIGMSTQDNRLRFYLHKILQLLILHIRQLSSA